ncbi:hypothetical protein MMC29_002925 [Sticta canariensis]|nr:hypothetical protein [Sticta canariensis]
MAGSSKQKTNHTPDHQSESLRISEVDSKITHKENSNRSIHEFAFRQYLKVKATSLLDHWEFDVSISPNFPPGKYLLKEKDHEFVIERNGSEIQISFIPPPVSFFREAEQWYHLYSTEAGDEWRLEQEEQWWNNAKDGSITKP